nr:hypothetical protein [Deltaproteobacteria bacterium]
NLWGRSNGRRVSFAIYDAAVFVAIAKLAKLSPAQQRARTADLLEAVLPITELRQAIYGGLRKQTLDALRPRAIELARFIASSTALGLKLKPVDLTAVGQLCGYDVGDGMSAKPFLVKAKKKWAAHPTVLTAIGKNERHWRELDEDNDDDDDDDDE